MNKIFATYKRDAEKNPLYALSGVGDFNATHIFDCGQCFRWRRQEDGSWSGIAGDRIANIKYENKTLFIRGLYGTTSPRDIEEFWIPYLDLDRDYGKIKRKLRKNDVAMAEAIKTGSGIRILKQDLWETIISFIISQNNNIPRIKGCIEALAELCGERIDGTRDKAFLEPKKNREMVKTGVFEGVYPLGDLKGFALPKPEVLASLKEKDLAPVKLGYRAKYLIQSAKEVLDRGMPENMEELIALTGVGPKVANCISLFGLHKTDSFPVDVWVKRVMHQVYGLDEEDAAAMEAFAKEHFGDLSGFAQQYLFYHIREMNGGDSAK